MSTPTFTFRSFPKWVWGVLAGIATIVLVVVLAGMGGGSSAPVATGQATPEGAAVVEVGALAGVNGEALLAVRQNGLTQLDVQWLQFTDLDGMVAGLALGTGNAAIVPEGTELADGEVVVARLYRVAKGEGADGVQVLIAPKDAAESAELQTLAKALQSAALLELLNAGSTGTVIERVG